MLRLHGRPDHFVQYVEATGTQHVDTGVVGRCNSAMEAHVMWVEVSDACFCGARMDNDNTRFNLYGCNTQHWMGHRTYTRSTDSTVEGSVPESPTVVRSTAVPDYVSSCISSDGTEVSYWMDVNGTRRIDQTRTEQGIDTGLDMYLFAQNKTGAPVLNSKVRCYDVKIVQDGVLVRDFRPCIKDGRVMFYDNVSKTMFKPYPAITATKDRYGRGGLAVIMS